MRRGLIVSGLAVACSISACEGVREPSSLPAAGSLAPAFQAANLEGDTVSLKSLEGNPVLLNLWATWCLPCRRETPYLQDVHQRFGSRGLQVVGVSVDSRSGRRDVDAFLQEFGVTYQILHDPEMRSMDVFAAIGLPATYLIGRDGTVLWRRIGPVEEGDIEFERALEDAVQGHDPEVGET